MPVLTSGPLFREVFGTAEMRRLVGETAFIDRFLETEAALARAEATVGLVPEDAAATITQNASVDSLDMEAVRDNVQAMGLFSMSIIEAWTDDLGEAGAYVHWGASTQDISDTAMVLVLQDALEVLLRDLVAVRDRILELAETHRGTPMVGRTQYAHGPPLTFGLKAATWADELDRHVERLLDLEDRLAVVQLAGASGTLGALGDDGVAVMEHFADELDLAAPRVGWTATRDRFAALANAFAMLAGALARMARELLLLNRREIDEVDEPVPAGEVGSSTNPHKRNPVYSQHTVGLARLVRTCAAGMNGGLESAGDRDRAAWYPEFALLPASCRYMARILENSKRTVDDLTVHGDQMRANLTATGSLVTSEAVMMALAETVGRQTAHALVRENAMEALDTDRSFRACLADDQRVTAHLSPADLDDLTDPSSYTGSAEAFVDRVRDSIGERDAE